MWRHANALDSNYGWCAREAPRSRVREARCRDGIRRRATALESRHAVRRARPHAGGPIGPMTCSARPGRNGVRPYMTAVPLPSPLASISPLPAVTTARSALAPGLDDVTNHEANFKGSRGKLFIVPERYNAISREHPPVGTKESSHLGDSPLERLPDSAPPRHVRAGEPSAIFGRTRRASRWPGRVVALADEGSAAAYDASAR